MQGSISNAVKRVFRFSRRGGVECIDFGPFPGPTRSRGGVGKAPAGAPLDLHRFACSCPSPGTTWETQNIKLAQTFFVLFLFGGVQGPGLRDERVKNQWGRRPHTFFTF